MQIDRVYNWRDEDREGLYLVDRLWPRGVKKESLKLAGWPKELTPSSDLRKEFHDGMSFEEFSEKYVAELDQSREGGDLDEILDELRDYQEQEHKGEAPEPLLLYAAKETEQNHAVVLCDWLKPLLKKNS